MAKKKRQNQSSNSAVGTMDSSESEENKETTQNHEGSKIVCPHTGKSVDLPTVKKTIKACKEKNIHLLCSICRKNSFNPCKDCWICLRCGSCNCGTEEVDHRTDHYKVPRSDTHYLALHLNTNVIWCFKCEREITVEAHKKVQTCADLVRKQYSENSTSSPTNIETDTTKMNGECTTSYLKSEIASSQPLRNISLNKELDKIELNLPKARGLSNLGNTCFFNSVLQCLAQTPGLVELLREMHVPGEKFHIELDGSTIDAVLEKEKASVLSEQLAQILTEVSGVNTVGDSKTGHFVVNPRGLLNALTQKCPQFRGGDQHDAHELLRHLLDSVHTEDLRRYQRAILKHIGYNKNLDELEEEKKKFGKKLNQKVCDTIPIRPDQIFKGSLVSILQCTECNHISKRDEPFLDLSLPVAQEKAQPPAVRRKQNCYSPVEEGQTTDVSSSKCRRNDIKVRLNRKLNKVYTRGQNQGEPTIVEEIKKDSIDEEQSDADVEDNEDNGCEERDQKAEIVESGYSSEKQMSARGSPVNTQSPEEESKCEFKPVVQESIVLSGCKQNTVTLKSLNEMLHPTSSNFSHNIGPLISKSSESGLRSIQELTVSIPDESNLECTSQDSLHVNAGNGSADISSDNQAEKSFKTGNLPSSDYKLLPSDESQVDRTAMIYDWNCTGDMATQSQESSSVSLSVSPQYGSQSSQDNIDNVSPKCSPKSSPLSGSHSNENMSVCTSLPPSNDNMSVCNSLPENISMSLNSPIKCENSSNKEENSGSEERPVSRMDCHDIECTKNRSSPVDLSEAAELPNLCSQMKICIIEGKPEEKFQSALCEVSTTQINETETQVDNEAHDEPLAQQTICKSPIPLPPPLPLFTAPYTFSHPEPTVSPSQRYTTHPRYKIEEGEFSLQSCLNQFTTIEMLAGGNKVGCEACTERINKGNKEGKTVYQNSTKQLLICKLPPVMIFHLKRFQVQRCSFRKISRHVDFPLVLDISPFCYENEANPAPTLYSLFGVVEHSGNLHGGHYVAYVKVRSHTHRQPGLPPPGKWYYISDSRVSEIEEVSVLKTQAYLLFYERIV